MWIWGFEHRIETGGLKEGEELNGLGGRVITILVVLLIPTGVARYVLWLLLSLLLLVSSLEHLLEETELGVCD